MVSSLGSLISRLLTFMFNVLFESVKHMTASTERCNASTPLLQPTPGCDMMEPNHKVF